MSWKWSHGQHNPKTIWLPATARVVRLFISFDFSKSSEEVMAQQVSILENHYP